MSTEADKAVVARYFEQVWNNGRHELMEEFFAGDVVAHNIPQLPGLDGRDSLRAVIGMSRESMPDMQFTLHDMIAEDNKVVARWSYEATHQGELMGIPATGNQVTVSGAGIYRLVDARIVEVWNFPDNLSLMQQLGAIPAPGEGGE